jgi:hypothetical protein
MTELLLTASHLKWLRGGLSHRIFYSPEDDRLVQGSSDHSGGCVVMLTPDDCEQVDWDLGVCSGIVLERLARCEEFEENGGDDELDEDVPPPDGPLETA